MYDELKSGFEHHYLQPCYVDEEDLEWNGKSFAAVEKLVKDNLVAVKSTDTQMDGGAVIRAVMALSGGMDSTALLCRLLADGYTVSCISYDYGQKHVIEIERAQVNIEYLAENNLAVEHRIVDSRE